MDGALGVAEFNLSTFKGFDLPKAIIPNGISLERFNPDNEKIDQFMDGKINILFVGRIEERKGLSYLLHSYKEIRKIRSDVRLIIVGEGVLEEECKEFCKSNDLEDVHFEGGKEDVRSYYTTCDIFCSPAIYGESFGIVLLEAMASGKPVVCYSNIGYKRVLEGTKGESLMVEPKDQSGLTEKLLSLIDNESFRQEMGRWGIEEAKKYSWDVVAKQILDFYYLCMDNKRNKE
jgi:phosphatidylinositol alpha-mannosyltransferase